MTIPTLRIARPTDHLEAIAKMYVDGLGLQVLGSFEDHAGFDGIMLGHPQAPYHLEFTRCRGHEVGTAPTLDNLLVFYLPEKEAWSEACAKMVAAAFVAVPSFNPYWDRDGRTFEDLDGYRVVLRHGSWDR